jgi:TP901 family phage tail tape measure protein
MVERIDFRISVRGGRQAVSAFGNVSAALRHLNESLKASNRILRGSVVEQVALSKTLTVNFTQNVKAIEAVEKKSQADRVSAKAVSEAKLSAADIRAKEGELRRAQRGVALIKRLRTQEVASAKAAADAVAGEAAKKAAAEAVAQRKMEAAQAASITRRAAAFKAFAGNLQTLATTSSAAVTRAFGSLGIAGPALRGSLRAFASEFKRLGSSAGTSFVGSLIQKITGGISKIIQLFGAVVGPVVAALGAIVKAAAQSINAVAASLAPIISLVVGLAGKAVGLIVSAFTTIAAPVAAALTGALSTGFGAVAGVVTTATGGILAAFTGAIGGVTQLFGGLLQGVTSVMASVVTVVGNAAAKLADLLSGLAGSILGGVQKIIDNTVGRILGSVGGIFTSLPGIIQKGLRAIVSPFTLIVGGLSIKAASDIRDRVINAFALLDDRVGLTVSNIENRLQELAADTGTSVTELADALFTVFSFGFRSAPEAFEILRRSAELATAGNASVFDSVKGVATILKAFKFEADSAGKVSQLLFDIQDRGNITIGELVANFATLIPTIKAANVPLSEIGALLSVLSRQGQSFSETVTALSQGIINLAAPIPQARRRMRDLGIETLILTDADKALISSLEKQQALLIERGKSLGQNTEAARANEEAVTRLGSRISTELQARGQFVGVTESLERIRQTLGGIDASELNFLRTIAPRVRAGRALAFLLDNVEEIREEQERIGKDPTKFLQAVEDAQQKVGVEIKKTIATLRELGLAIFNFGTAVTGGKGFETVREIISRIRIVIEDLTQRVPVLRAKFLELASIIRQAFLPLFEIDFGNVFKSFISAISRVLDAVRGTDIGGAIKAGVQRGVEAAQRILEGARFSTFKSIFEPPDVGEFDEQVQVDVGARGIEETQSRIDSISGSAVAVDVGVTGADESKRKIKGVADSVSALPDRKILETILKITPPVDFDTDRLNIPETITSTVQVEGQTAAVNALRAVRGEADRVEDVDVTVRASGVSQTRGEINRLPDRKIVRIQPLGIDEVERAVKEIERLDRGVEIELGLTGDELVRSKIESIEGRSLGVRLVARGVEDIRSAVEQFRDRRVVIGLQESGSEAILATVRRISDIAEDDSILFTLDIEGDARVRRRIDEIVRGGSRDVSVRVLEEGADATLQALDGLGSDRKVTFEVDLDGESQVQQALARINAPPTQRIPVVADGIDEVQAALDTLSVVRQATVGLVVREADRAEDILDNVSRPRFAPVAVDFSRRKAQVAEQSLDKLQESRAVDLGVNLQGSDEARQQLDRAARDRESNIQVALRGRAQAQSELAGIDSPTPRVIPVEVEGAEEGQRKLDRLQAPREAPVSVALLGGAEASRRVARLTRDREVGVGFKLNELQADTLGTALAEIEIPREIPVTIPGFDRVLFDVERLEKGRRVEVEAVLIGDERVKQRLAAISTPPPQRIDVGVTGVDDAQREIDRITGRSTSISLGLTGDEETADSLDKLTKQRFIPVSLDFRTREVQELENLLIPLQEPRTVGIEFRAIGAQDVRRELDQSARERQARFVASVSGTESVRTSLREVRTERDVDFVAQVEGDGPAAKRLDEVAETREATIIVRSEGIPGIRSQLRTIPSPPPVPVKVEFTSDADEVAAFAFGLEAQISQASRNAARELERIPDAVRDLGNFDITGLNNVRLAFSGLTDRINDGLRIAKEGVTELVASGIDVAQFASSFQTNIERASEFSRRAILKARLEFDALAKSRPDLGSDALKNILGPIDALSDELESELDESKSILKEFGDSLESELITSAQRGATGFAAIGVALKSSLQSLGISSASILDPFIARTAEGVLSIAKIKTEAVNAATEGTVAFRSFGDFIKATFNAVLGEVNKISEVLSAGGKGFDQTVIGGFFAFLEVRARLAINRVLQDFAKLRDGVGKVVAQTVGIFVSGFGGIVQAVADLISEVSSEIVTFARKLPGVIVSSITGGVLAVVELFDKLSNPIKLWFSKDRDEIVSEAFSAAEEAAAAIAGTITFGEGLSRQLLEFRSQLARDVTDLQINIAPTLKVDDTALFKVLEAFDARIQSLSNRRIKLVAELEIGRSKEISKFLEGKNVLSLSTSDAIKFNRLLKDADENTKALVQSINAVDGEMFSLSQRAQLLVGRLNEATSETQRNLSPARLYREELERQEQILTNQVAITLQNLQANLKSAQLRGEAVKAAALQADITRERGRLEQLNLKSISRGLREVIGFEDRRERLLREFPVLTERQNFKVVDLISRQKELESNYRTLKELEEGRLEIAKEFVAIMNEAGLSTAETAAQLDDITRQFKVGGNITVRGEREGTPTISSTPEDEFKELVRSGQEQIGVTQQINKTLVSQNQVIGSGFAGLEAGLRGIGPIFARQVRQLFTTAGISRQGVGSFVGDQQRARGVGFIDFDEVGIINLVKDIFEQATLGVQNVGLSTATLLDAVKSLRQERRTGEAPGRFVGQVEGFLIRNGEIIGSSINATLSDVGQEIITGIAGREAVVDFLNNQGLGLDSLRTLEFILNNQLEVQREAAKKNEELLRSLGATPSQPGAGGVGGGSTLQGPRAGDVNEFVKLLQEGGDGLKEARGDLSSLGSRIETVKAELQRFTKEQGSASSVVVSGRAELERLEEAFKKQKDVVTKLSLETGKTLAGNVAFGSLIASFEAINTLDPSRAFTKIFDEVGKIDFKAFKQNFSEFKDLFRDADIRALIRKAFRGDEGAREALQAASDAQAAISGAAETDAGALLGAADALGSAAEALFAAGTAIAESFKAEKVAAPGETVGGAPPAQIESPIPAIRDTSKLNLAEIGKLVDRASEGTELSAAQLAQIEELKQLTRETRDGVSESKRAIDRDREKAAEIADLLFESLREDRAERRQRQDEEAKKKEEPKKKRGRKEDDAAAELEGVDDVRSELLQAIEKVKANFQEKLDEVLDVQRQVNEDLKKVAELQQKALDTTRDSLNRVRRAWVRAGDAIRVLATSIATFSNTVESFADETTRRIRANSVSIEDNAKAIANHERRLKAIGA